MTKSLFRRMLRAISNRRRKQHAPGDVIQRSVEALSPRYAAPTFLESLEARVLMSFDPTASEQLMLELLNRMRMDPAGELARLTSSLGTPARSTDPDVDSALDFFNVNGATLAAQWAALTAAAPLAWNESLINVADAHNAAMIAGDVQSHEAPGEPPLASDGLRTRFNNQGYSSQSTIGENIFAFTESVFHGHAALAIDWGDAAGGAIDGIQNPAGHRDNMMSSDFREVGIRITAENSGATDVGPLVLTQDFGGVNAVANPFILGVAYQDGDGDRFYDIGEGLAGVSVNVLGINGTSGSFNTTSMTAGGWQLAVPAGTYQVTFSGGGIAVPVVRSNVVVGDDNVKVDSTFAEISITGNAVPIADGDAAPTAGDNTDFGSLDVTGATVQKTFTIENIGTVPLNLTGSPRVQIAGAAAGDFTVTTQPAVASVGGGGSTSFIITFNPSAAGLRTATVEVLSDDADESLYNFAIQGIGTQQPEIDIRGNAVSIVDGDAAPAEADHTSYANVNITGATRTRTYTIHNSGSTALNLTGNPRVQIIGTNAADFSVTLQPDAAVASGGSSAFDVTFDPSATGLRTATVRVFSDDSDEALYEFAVSGTGVNPEIDIQGNSTSVPDGDAAPRTQDFTDFRQVPVSSSGLTSVTRTFTIRNTGGTSLTLGGNPLVVISGANAGDFAVITQPATSVIAGAASTTFTIAFNPSAAGLRTATVTVVSDDSDEATYDFAIAGTGIVTTTSGNGLQVAILEAGTGGGAVSGQGVSMIYTGYLTTGAQFDSNVGGNLFSFKLGAGSVIQGWDLGLVGMKVGEKRTLVVPGPLAYGANPPSGSGIPANATLIFEVERVAGEISVGSPQSGTVIAITDGDTTPSTSDHTDMGPVTLGGAAAQWTFRISTTGALNLPGTSPITIDGPDKSAFSIVQQPLSPILPGSGSATAFRDFVVTFNPSRLGAHSATLSIASDDADENPYTFDVQGTGIANRLVGAVEDTDFVITHATLNSAMKESGSSAYIVESVQSGQLFKNGVLVEPGVTTISSGQSLVWRPGANVNRTQNAFTVKLFNGTTAVGDAEAIRVEVTPVDDNPTGTIGDITLGNAANQSIDLAPLFSDADITGTIARIVTSLGAVDIHLFNGRAPQTVANFLKYITDGDYTNTIFHRVVTAFVVQGGGYRPQLPASHIATDPAVVNEFGVSSQRGTVAMAKTGNVVNSATSEWFFNLGDNAANLDNQNGGFTVFGEVIGNGMAVVDDIAATPLYTDGGTFPNLPLRNYSGGALQDSNWIKLLTATTVANLSFSVVGNTNAALVTPTVDGGELDLAFAAGVAGSSDVTVRVTDLSGRTHDETFTVTIHGVGVEAIDDQAAEPAGGQDANIGRFRITRTGDTTDALAIGYTLGGSAGSGVDFTAIPVFAVIPAGMSFVDVDITPLVDGGSEGIETVTMTLNAAAGYTVSGGPATVSIFDNKPIISIAASDASATETAGGAGQFIVSRTGETTSDLTVHLLVSGGAASGADYTTIPLTVVIPAGQSSATVDVSPTDDAVSEVNETVILGLAEHNDYVLDDDDEATVTISDNDIVRVLIAAQDADLAEGAVANSGVFRISRTGSTAADLIVKFKRGGKATFGAATGDYTLALGPTNLTTTAVTIPAGSEFVDITVNVNDDTKPDAGEVVTMTLSSGTGYSLPVVVAERSASMMIADDEPIVSVASVGFTGADNAGAETDDGEAGNRAFFRISRTGSTAAPMVVKFSRTGTARINTDYVVTVNGIVTSTTSVTIPAGSDHIDVFIDPVNDQTVEPNESVILKIAANTKIYSVDPDLADQMATVTLGDNEPFVSVAIAGFTGADAVAAETNTGETSNGARFRISRTAAGPPMSVAFKLTGTARRGTAATSDYFITVNGQLVTASSIVIPNNATFVDVVVVVVNDTIPEPGAADTVILTLGKASKSYNLDADLADRAATVTIADNEPKVSITVVDATAAEPGGDANNGRLRISRTGTTTLPLDVTLKIAGTAAGGADYLKLPTKVTIPAGASFIDLDIKPLIGTAVEVPETVIVSLPASSFYAVDAAASSGTVTIADGVAAAGADLVLLSVANQAMIFDLGTGGPLLAVSGTVRNQGDSATGDGFQIRAILSKDRSVDDTDIVLGAFNFNALAAGSSLNFNGSFNLGTLGITNSQTGVYFVILVADHGGAVAEAIETNNVEATYLANVVIQP